MDRTLFGEADHGNSEPDITRSARHRNYKLHYDRLTKKRALYDLGADPGERIDLVSRQPEISDQLLKEILRFMEIKADGIVPTQKLTPEQIEKLESLGYVDQ